MTIALLIAGGMSVAFALGLWLGRTDFRDQLGRQDRLFRERQRRWHDGTKRLAAVPKGGSGFRVRRGVVEAIWIDAN